MLPQLEKARRQEGRHKDKETKREEETEKQRERHQLLEVRSSQGAWEQFPNPTGDV